jgi:hypothetical protein
MQKVLSMHTTLPPLGALLLSTVPCKLLLIPGSTQCWGFLTLKHGFFFLHKPDTVPNRGIPECENYFLFIWHSQHTGECLVHSLLYKCLSLVKWPFRGTLFCGSEAGKEVERGKDPPATRLWAWSYLPTEDSFYQSSKPASLSRPWWLCSRPSYLKQTGRRRDSIQMTVYIWVKTTDCNRIT